MYTDNTNDTNAVVVFSTSDGGKSWTSTTPVTGAGLDGFSAGAAPPISFVGSDTWVLGTGAGVYITTDGGDSWAHQASQVDLSGIATVDFVDPSTGWVSVSNETCLKPKTDCTATGELLRTTDGGRSWMPQKP